MLRAARLRLRLPPPRVILGTNLLVACGALLWVLWRMGGPALHILAAAPSWPRLAGFVAIVGVLMLGFALRWRIVLGGLGPAPRFAALVAYRLAAQSISMLVPSAKLGGEPVRTYLLVRAGIGAPAAIAGVAVDRILDMGAGMGFTVLFGAVLLRHGVPSLEGTLESVIFGASALLVGIVVTVRRLRGGRGVVTSMARSMGLERFDVVGRRMGVLEESEDCATRLVGQPGRMALAFAVGVAINVAVLVEYWMLLSAFGLPTQAIAVVAAIFGTGAAHAMPVPAGLGVLEASQIFLFTALGHGPETGLAVGLAVRLRELVWMLPGLVYLVARGLGGMLVRETVGGPSRAASADGGGE